MDWKKTLLICGIILIAGAALTTLIFFTEPTATRVGATKETAMLVDVTDIERGT
ncbi:efflux transporter periplasmic adaptor subunit, partial [candidate division KSB1 bacterium]|nr:efflux transporter periplasmic adaptor subunit [candidate division KSB1 bacterium]NIR73025.1 efflux transporter periplasmic adaptor subunit [candidate division KSB1 bacterium]NIS23805.1 efflux transporter periplasmic adaptor subunit [candidate division KSB1 bacterium]NIT70732.1 efflux transporter periplasmic adaptor subunit [candidate division KSB1 bacterium]NIU24455.1 efflux transporter periplasmic adaptor subunit [candidate division KSB1 bacterium]